MNRDSTPFQAAARGFATLLFLGTAAAASAQTGSDADLCASITSNPDLAIQHCTKAIDSKRYSGEPLAQLHYNRGIELAAKGYHDRAIADYDAAIRLDPRLADAYYNRGNAWGAKFDTERAIADYDAAIRLNPKDAAALGSRAFEWTMKGDYARSISDQDAVIRLNPKSSLAYLGRGRARFYAGDLQGAIADLRAAMKLEPNSYTALWTYLARKRASVDGEDQLDQGTADIHGGGWPWPVVALYLGRTDVQSVMAAATDRDAARQRSQLCEANFYVAHWYLMKKDREHALPLLNVAKSECPREFMEHEGAVAELRRLQKP